MQEFKVTDRYENNVAIVTCQGRFDAYTIEQIKPVFDKATLAIPANIIVDLKNVTFIDSTALAELVRLMKNARLSKGDLVLCALAQPVRIIFELTRLDRAFQIASDLDGARRLLMSAAEMA